MIITNIKKSAKGNIVIYADNQYLTSLPHEVFIKSHLKIGSYIDEDIVKEVTVDSNAHKAKDKALRILSVRAHSKKELEEKIKRSSDEQSAKTAVKRMEDLGLIDDSSFAKSYALELSNRKFYSVNRIKYELVQKGISRDIICEILEEIEIDEQDNIERFLNSKYYGKLHDEKFKRRAVAALQRLGYGWSQINSAFNFLI